MFRVYILIYKKTKKSFKKWSCRDEKIWISLTIIAYILKKQRFSLYEIVINYLLSPFFYAIFSLYTDTQKS